MVLVKDLEKSSLVGGPREELWPKDWATPRNQSTEAEPWWVEEPVEQRGRVTRVTSKAWKPKVKQLTADQGDDGASEDNRETREREEPGEAKGEEGWGRARDPEVCGGSWVMTNRGLSGCTREPSRVLGPQWRWGNAEPERSRQADRPRWRHVPGGLKCSQPVVEMKPETWLMSHTELAAEAEPRSWMTPVGPTNPGEWLKPPEEMGSGIW